MVIPSTTKICSVDSCENLAITKYRTKVDEYGVIEHRSFGSPICQFHTRTMKEEIERIVKDWWSEQQGQGGPVNPSTTGDERSGTASAKNSPLHFDLDF